MNCYFSNIFNMFMICYYTTHAYHLILLKSMMEVFFFYSFFFLTLTMFCILAINCNDCVHDTRSYSVVLQQRLNNIVDVRL